MGWRASGRSPISSRKSVPDSAAATFPRVSLTAPVNAPRAWPKSSLSSNSALRLGQLTVTNGALRTAAPTVDRPSQDSLPRAALAPDQYHRVGTRDLTALLQYQPDLRIVALERDLGDLDGDLLLQIVHAVLKAPEPLDALHDGADLGRQERFRQVIEGASPHGLDRRVDRPVGRDDHHRHLRRPPQARLQQVEPRVDAQPEIHQRQVEPRSLDPLQRLVDPRGLFDRVTHRFEGHSQRHSDVRLVVNDEDSHGWIG